VFTVFEWSFGGPGNIFEAILLAIPKPTENAFDVVLIARRISGIVKGRTHRLLTDLLFNVSCLAKWPHFWAEWRTRVE
jgi:hypothetical protein